MKKILVIFGSETDIQKRFNSLNNKLNENLNENVIFIEEPRNEEELTNQLREYSGEYDKVFVASHGYKNGIGEESFPFMFLSSNYRPSIDRIVNIINKDNQTPPKEIHLVACYIGAAVNYQKEPREKLKQALKNSPNGQNLFLHGGDYENINLQLETLLILIKNPNSDFFINSISSLPEDIILLKKDSQAQLKILFFQPSIGDILNIEGSTEIEDKKQNLIEKTRLFLTNQITEIAGESGEINTNFTDEQLSKWIETKAAIDFVALPLRALEIYFDLGEINLLQRGLVEICYSDNPQKEFIVKELLNVEGIDINWQHKDNGYAALINNGYATLIDNGYTALIWATEKGDLDIVERLLRVEGIDINWQRKDNGRTALILATEKGNLDIVKRLLMVDGIDVNLQDNDGWTVLISATEKGDLDIVERLLRVDGIDVNLKNNDGLTALMYAVVKEEVVERLLRVDGIDVNLKNNDGLTALHFAADVNNKEIYRLLLNNGAKPNLTDEFGKTPLDYVSAESLEEFQEILSQSRQKDLTHVPEVPEVISNNVKKGISGNNNIVDTPSTTINTAGMTIALIGVAMLVNKVLGNPIGKAFREIVGCVDKNKIKEK